MKIGLIDVDSHHYPNLALMKLSAWHKARGDTVEWWWGFGQYDRVYMSKVFDETYTPDIPEPLNATEIVKGGTGYGLDNALPAEIEHIYPDYSLYPALTKDTAYGFLYRGCPNNCPFCIVPQKEGRRSVKVADLSEWWHGQRNIVLMDPNILACPQHIELLGQLAESGAWVNIDQGADARLLTARNIAALNRIRLRMIHFAWDMMEQSDVILAGLRRYAKAGAIQDHRRRIVYVLTNFGTSMEENLYRIYTLRDLGYDPYVMVYDKPHAPIEVTRLQRWCNNRMIFKSETDFSKYVPR